MSELVSELIRLLGEPVVFIGWPRGVKGTKKLWGHLKPADMTPEYLAKLQDGNIGVALGTVSGGLCAIDLDDDRYVEPFLALNLQLRDTLQTHGSRGRVFWIRFTGAYPAVSSKLQSISGEIGEFRSNGNQSIVWGIHPDTKKPYTFVLRQQAVQVDFASIKWPDTIVNPPALQSRQRVRSHLCNSASPSAPSALPSPPLCLSVKTVQDVVGLCISQKEHQNNNSLFRLARGMLAIKASHADRVRAFDLWYQESAARRVLRHGQSRDQYLVEFMNACRKAKLPLGSGPAETAWQRAAIETPPPEAAQFTSQEGKLLVGLCWQLNKLAKGKPWFLPTRIAAQLTGKSHATIATWLSAFVEIGFIEIVEKSTSTKATRYRYVLPQNGD